MNTILKLAIALGVVLSVATPSWAAQYKRVGQDEFVNRPNHASPYQCWNDEGYGRYTPCDAGN